MTVVLLGLGLLQLCPVLAWGPAAQASVSARPDDDDDGDGDGRRRRSREHDSPIGRHLEMGPAATGVALVALAAAVVARRRRRARVS